MAVNKITITPKPIELSQKINELINEIGTMLPSSELTDAINQALEEAHASGQFDGADGVSPNISIGTVTTGAAGTSASASITGTTPNLVLNLTIPRGATGSAGAKGADGKSAYQSAQSAGYGGTESQFNADLAAIGDISSVLNAINGEVI